MQPDPPLRVQLVIDFTSHIPLAGDLENRKEEFIVALSGALETDDFANLQRSQTTQNILTALIEPPTRIGEAMQLTRVFLKQYKLQRGTTLGFERI
jgi:hypothetical protein